MKNGADAERLTGYKITGEGVEHPFRDSIATNLVKLVDVLPKLNVTNDPELERLTGQVHASLLVDPKELRQSESVRAETAKTAAEIAQRMASYRGVYSAPVKKKTNIAVASKNGHSPNVQSKPKLPEADKSLESWIWDAACSIRGAKDAGKYKEFILPLIFTKRLCDVFDDELNRIAKEVGSRAKAFKLVKHDKKLVRFYLPLQPKNPDDTVWSVIRTLSDKIGEQLTTHLRAIADANPLLKGIVGRIHFNPTTRGQRDIDDDRLSNLIEEISAKRLGLSDVEPDIIGRSHEYLIRKFAEGSGQSAGEALERSG